MAQDPAFLFYSSDFLTGTQFFTNEQKGKYITLLCMQHQQGHLHEKHMIFICGTNDKDVIEKFAKDDAGLYYNIRLEKETEKRKKYSESRRENRINGIEKAKNKNDKTNPTKTSKRSKSYVQHMENENENINEDIIGIKKGVQGEREKLVMPFMSEQFLNAWDNWKKYKLAEFKFSYSSIQSEQAALTKLVKFAGGIENVAIEIIIESMANGWKGLFEIKQNNNGKSTTSNIPERNTGVKQAIHNILGDTSRSF